MQHFKTCDRARNCCDNKSSQIILHACFYFYKQCRKAHERWSKTILFIVTVFLKGRNWSETVLWLDNVKQQGTTEILVYIKVTKDEFHHNYYFTNLAAQ